MRTEQQLTDEEIEQYTAEVFAFCERVDDFIRNEAMKIDEVKKASIIIGSYKVLVMGLTRKLLLMAAVANDKELPNELQRNIKRGWIAARQRSETLKQQFGEDNMMH